MEHYAGRLFSENVSPFTADPIALYRSIRQLNPSPYMYYLNLDEFYIVGSSPEILARLEDDKVTGGPLQEQEEGVKTMKMMWYRKKIWSMTLKYLSILC